MPPDVFAAFIFFFLFPSRDSFHLLPSCVGTAEENDLLQLFTQSFATLKLCLTATLCLTVPPAWRHSAWTVRGEAPQQVSKHCRSLSLPSSRLRCQPNVNWELLASTEVWHPQNLTDDGVVLHIPSLIVAKFLFYYTKTCFMSYTVEFQSSRGKIART